MKLKNVFQNSLFLNSLKLAKSNPGKFGMMILFDALFLISFFMFQNFFKYAAPYLSVPQAPNNIYSAINIIIFSLIYYLSMLFVYSFFKYCLLDFIKSLFGPGKFSFEKLGHFYLLNIIIAGIFFVVSVIAGAIFFNIKEAYQPYIFIVIASPYWIVFNKYSALSLHSLIFYIVVNISHSLFYEGASLKETIMNGLGVTFTKIRSYRKAVSVIILATFAFGILFLGMNYLVLFLQSKNFSLSNVLYPYINKSFFIIFYAVFYVIFLINRISFYKAVKEHK